MLPGMADQRVDVDVFDGLAVRFVLPVHATVPGGLPHIDPVGGPVAGSSKAIRGETSRRVERGEPTIFALKTKGLFADLHSAC